MVDTVAQTDAVFGDFVQANYPALFRTAVLLTGSRAPAEDLVQDALAKLYPQWSRVVQSAVPLAYVRATLTNTFLSGRRLAASKELVMADIPDTGVARDTAEIATDRGFALHLLRQLTDRQRSAVVTRYFHDFDDEQIADALGCRKASARSLLSRALAQMRADSAMDEPTLQGGLT